MIFGGFFLCFVAAFVYAHVVVLEFFVLGDSFGLPGWWMAAPKLICCNRLKFSPDAKIFLLGFSRLLF